jgi:hypothetical protein
MQGRLETEKTRKRRGVREREECGASGKHNFRHLQREAHVRNEHFDGLQVKKCYPSNLYFAHTYERMRA